MDEEVLRVLTKAANGLASSFGGPGARIPRGVSGGGVLQNSIGLRGNSLGHSSGVFTLHISVVKFAALHTGGVNTRFPEFQSIVTQTSLAVVKRGNGGRLGGGGGVRTDRVAAILIFVFVLNVMIAKRSMS